jgi:hypothetical protein
VTGPPSETTTEVLDLGPRQRRRPTWSVAVLLVAVLAASLVWLEGARRAPAERAALGECTARAEQVVRDAEERLARMATFVSPRLGSPSSALQATLLGLVAREAEGALPSIEQALRRCQDLDVWPLARERGGVRAAYAAWLRAEQQRLRRVAADGAQFYATYAEVAALGREAARLAEEAA